LSHACRRQPVLLSRLLEDIAKLFPIPFSI